MPYLYEEIPNSIQQRMDNQITVEVPATPNRKAYSYTKNGGMGGKSAGLKKIGGMSRGSFVKAGAAGAVGGAAILALRLAAGKKQAKRMEDEKGEDEEQAKKSRSLELNRRKRRTRRNSLDERIDSFIADLKSKV